MFLQGLSTKISSLYYDPSPIALVCLFHSFLHVLRQTSAAAPPMLPPQSSQLQRSTSHLLESPEFRAYVVHMQHRPPRYIPQTQEPDTHQCSSIINKKIALINF
eukprot:TRINITY_DN15837_c0_g1_i2.p1 TRINITY_DN15837_c0_g1~~TRINITY_DN15837_c0_g1_i2.p1  ORF type:complete len:104 (-),score=11.74 TRINITY_DN15837_c0_g1_i2:532-843(-)